jgi:hypothetical protein
LGSLSYIYSQQSKWRKKLEGYGFARKRLVVRHYFFSIFATFLVFGKWLKRNKFLDFEKEAEIN